MRESGEQVSNYAGAAFFFCTTFFDESLSEEDPEEEADEDSDEEDSTGFLPFAAAALGLDDIFYM